MICCVVDIWWVSEGRRGEGVTAVTGEMTADPVLEVRTWWGVSGEVGRAAEEGVRGGGVPNRKTNNKVKGELIIIKGIVALYKH